MSVKIVTSPRPVRLTNGDIPDAVANFKTFKANSVRGEFREYGASVGSLPYEYTKALGQAFADHNEVYVVYSYQTPIAWHAGGVWTVPEVKYSVTTTKQQTLVRRGINK